MRSCLNTYAFFIGFGMEIIDLTPLPCGKTRLLLELKPGEEIAIHNQGIHYLLTFPSKPEKVAAVPTVLEEDNDE